MKRCHLGAPVSVNSFGATHYGDQVPKQRDDVEEEPVVARITAFLKDLRRPQGSETDIMRELMVSTDVSSTTARRSWNDLNASGCVINVEDVSAPCGLPA